MNMDPTINEGETIIFIILMFNMVYTSQWPIQESLKKLLSSFRTTSSRHLKITADATIPVYLYSLWQNLFRNMFIKSPVWKVCIKQLRHWVHNFDSIIHVYTVPE